MFNPLLHLLSPNTVSVERYPKHGKYSSYRIDREHNWTVGSGFKIMGNLRKSPPGAERRLAGGFRTVNDAEKYIARFLPEFLDCTH